MAALDALGVALLTICALLVLLLARRRLLSRGGGTVEMSVRLRHWTFGVARFDRDRLLWFRTFSLSPRPRRDLPRGTLHVERRRPPHRTELLGMTADAVVLECSIHGKPVEIALPSSAALGFLAWLEAGQRTRAGSRPDRSAPRP